jgi:hypothetical protein
MIAAVDPASARGAARQILNGRRYRGAPVPRPLHSILRWIGDRLSPISHWIGDRFSWLPSWAVPLVKIAALIAAGALIVVFVTALVNANAKARAARAGADTDDHRANAGADDPTALEAAAAAAEAQGDLALAVRLRFRAGLLRLDRDAHAIAYRPSMVTGDVRAELASPTFDELADTFENIAYGSIAAEPTDTDGARRDWPRVVASARRK